jgi:predicted MFS family arabinose efflux permease
VVLGTLFLHYKGNISLLTATTLAAIYLGYRRICLVAFSPAGGWIADTIGIARVFNLSLAAMIIGLTLLAFGWIELGAIIVFTFYSIHAAITPGKISYQQTHQLSAVAVNATWRDIGAAVGTLIGGLLLTSNYLTTILVVAIVYLTLLLLIHLGKTHTTYKLLYLWK